jgi:AraC-like DNA-binding protein
MSFTTLSQVIWPVLDSVRARGLALPQILRESGYSEAQLRAPNTRIPRPALLAILRALAPLTNEPGAGFLSATFLRAESFDLLEYIARTSDTLRDAIEVVNRFAPICDDSASFRLEGCGDMLLWRLDMDWPDDVRPAVLQYLWAVLGALGARVLGAQVPAEEVWFAHAAPASLRMYEQALRAKVRFNAPCDGALFRPEVLSQSTKTRDPALANLLRRTAENELAKLDRPESLHSQLASTLQSEIEHGNCSLERVARRLGTTPDSLRRRLRAERTSYRILLAEARLTAARGYLTRRSLPLSEVASRLGFRSASSFFRWFKERTGQTPANYRAASTRDR